MPQISSVMKMLPPAPITAGNDRSISPAVTTKTSAVTRMIEGGTENR